MTLTVILCKVVDEKYWSESSKSFGYLSPESLLHILGYNVSESYGLTQQQRWKLLETIVDNRIISKTKIVDHLNMLCRLNGGRSSLENAVHKWEADRHHILMYSSANNRIVHVESITHRFRE